MSDLYRDFIDQKADQIITDLGGTITPAPPNELYRDFLDRKFDDVINAIGNVKVKSLTYVGTGTGTHIITFPTKPKYIMSINRESDNVDRKAMNTGCLIEYGVTTVIPVIFGTGTFQLGLMTMNYIDDYNVEVWGGSAGQSANGTGLTYTVYYI